MEFRVVGLMTVAVREPEHPVGVDQEGSGKLREASTVQPPLPALAVQVHPHPRGSDPRAQELGRRALAQNTPELRTSFATHAWQNGQPKYRRNDITVGCSAHTSASENRLPSRPVSAGSGAGSPT